MTGVLLVGDWGTGDPVAETVCRAVGTALGPEVTVVSPDPEGTRRRHGLRAVPPTAGGVRRALAAATAVVFAGGTVFASRPPGRPGLGLARSAVLQRLARARRIPVGFIGVGAGDLRGLGDRRLAGWIADRADLLILRDEECAAALGAAGATGPFWLGADLAWWGTTPMRAAIGPNRDALVVATGGGADGPESYERLAAALLVSAPDRQLLVLPGADDPRHRRVAEFLGDRLAGRGRVLPARASVAGVMDVVAAAGVVVATSRAAALAAGLVGGRLLAVGDGAQAGLARRLGQQSVAATAPTPELARAVTGALEQRPVDPDAVADQIELADRAVDLVRLMVGRGAVERPETIRPLTLTHWGGTK